MALNRADVLSEVVESVAETLNIPVTDLCEETRIREDLNADSMDVVTLMVLLDDKFNAEFRPEDIPGESVTIRWVVNHIIEKLESAATPS